MQDEKTIKPMVRSYARMSGYNCSNIGPSMLCAPAEESKVATILHIFPLLFLLPPLFKSTEGVVVLFQIFAWAPN